MPLYIAGVEVGVSNNIVVDGDDNILVYKYQDLVKINQEGGTLATDAEYEAAEEHLQILYKKVMEGV